jgi:uncharacterized metal-binding protein
MSDRMKKKPVLVIPCSGIGKVHGLLSREATYLVTDEIAPEQTDTMCLALLVKGDSEALEAVKSQACITIDGCPKAGAEKNVKIAGGTPSKIVQVDLSPNSFLIRGSNPVHNMKQPAFERE